MVCYVTPPNCCLKLYSPFVVLAELCVGKSGLRPPPCKSSIRWTVNLTFFSLALQLPKAPPSPLFVLRHCFVRVVRETIKDEVWNFIVENKFLIINVVVAAYFYQSFMCKLGITLVICSTLKISVYWCLIFRTHDQAPHAPWFFCF